MIQLNHITYSVSDLNVAIRHYNCLFNKEPVAVGKNLAYYNLDGIWFALNVEELDRVSSYQHVAFTFDDDDLINRLNQHHITFDLGRSRNCGEKSSIYIRDQDFNMIEIHTGTLEDRLAYYENNREDITIYRG